MNKWRQNITVYFKLTRLCGHCWPSWPSLVAKLARKTFASTILVNARRKRHFQKLSGYFGYCQISLNTEKIIILLIFFCKSRVLTRLCCNLAIFDKNTRFVAFFPIDDFLGYHFRALKAIKFNFTLVNM